MLSTVPVRLEEDSGILLLGTKLKLIEGPKVNDLVITPSVLIALISGTLAGIAVVVYTARLGSAQNITGSGWELNAIAAAVIGGTLLTGGFGYVLGSVVGALVLGLMNVLITRDAGIPPEATTIITGGIRLIFVLLQRAVMARQRE